MSGRQIMMFGCGFSLPQMCLQIAWFMLKTVLSSWNIRKAKFECELEWRITLSETMLWSGIELEKNLYTCTTKIIAIKEKVAYWTSHAITLHVYNVIIKKTKMYTELLPVHHLLYRLAFLYRTFSWHVKDLGSRLHQVWFL